MSLLEPLADSWSKRKLHMEANKLCPPHLDHATYIGSVAARETGSRGCGLFTAKKIKTGGLLLCEKAFAHAFVDAGNQKNSASMCLLLNTETERMTMGG